MAERLVVVQVVPGPNPGPPPNFNIRAKLIPDAMQKKNVCARTRNGTQERLVVTQQSKITAN